MMVSPRTIGGVLLLEVTVQGESRVYFLETWNQIGFSENGI